jgi:hypothetical protein
MSYSLATMPYVEVFFKQKIKKTIAAIQNKNNKMKIDISPFNIFLSLLADGGINEGSDVDKYVIFLSISISSFDP